MNHDIRPNERDIMHSYTNVANDNDVMRKTLISCPSILNRSESSLPFVSIIIPCFNEEKYIHAMLTDVLCQDYPKNRMEIIISDGMSSDNTRDIIAQFMKEDSRIIFMNNLMTIQVTALNDMIKVAKGDVIIRMDVHSNYNADYVSRCIEVLEKTGADNVGGAARPRAVNTFQRALCTSLASPLAVGGAKYRSADAEGFVDTVPFGAFRRSVFEKVGLFDRNAITNEDSELNQRIAKAGGKIYLSKNIVMHYYPRNSIFGLIKQYFRYGKGRARTMLMHRGLPKVRPMVPFSFVIFSILLIAIPHCRPISPWIFGMYAALTGLEALRISGLYNILRTLIVWAIFPSLHISHGVGFAVGLIKYLLYPDWSEPELLPERNI